MHAALKKMPRHLGRRATYGLLFLSLLMFCSSCSSHEFQGYTLERPDTVLNLPKVMREVSGLAWLKKDHVAMVQDEEGRVFVYDISKGRIVDQQKFGKDGDHEAIASDGRHIYVVRSDGKIYRIDPETGKQDAKWDTWLTSKNDVEGGCWDVASGRLLLACKGDPGQGLDGHDLRAVYAFDPETGVLDTKPFLLVHLEAIAKALQASGQAAGAVAFAPSSIKVHPVTGLYWLLSAHGRMIVALARDGTVVQASRLSPTLFPQPEGMTFDDVGTLYLSSEGRKGAGRLLVYKSRSAE